jgi:hypothetical protein
MRCCNPTLFARTPRSHSNAALEAFCRPLKGLGTTTLGLAPQSLCTCASVRVHVCVVQVHRQHLAGASVVGGLAVRPLVRGALVHSVLRLVLALRHRPQGRPRPLLGPLRLLVPQGRPRQLLGPLRLPAHRLVLVSLLLAKLRLAFLLPLRICVASSPCGTRILSLASRH